MVHIMFPMAGKAVSDTAGDSREIAPQIWQALNEHGITASYDEALPFRKSAANFD